VATWTDDFNRGTGIGANWTGSVGSDLTIDSSIRVTGTNGVDSSMYWNANTPTAAQYAQVKHLTIPQFGGAFVRGSATDWVQLDGQSGGVRWAIFWYNAGSFTQIGSYYNTAPAANDVGKITANGSDFEGFVNGTSRISGSNASAPSTGFTGIYIFSNVAFFDDFEGGDLGGGAGQGWLW
jgi:hypothetical protein